MQKHLRSVVEGKLRAALGAVPEFLEDNLPQAARSWCKKRLYEVLDEVLSQENALSAFRKAFPESVINSLMGDEHRRALVELCFSKGEESVPLVWS